jgi:hypothetical protein
MHSRIKLALAALALCLTSACSADSLTEASYESGPNGIQAGYVAFSATADGILVSNQTSRPIYLIAMERSLVPLLDWIPCTSGCPSQAPGEQRLVPWNSVVGASTDRREYQVYWWHAVSQPDGSLRAGNVTGAVVTR